MLHDVVQGFAAPAPKAREQNVTASGSTDEGFEDLFLAHYARILASLRFFGACWGTAAALKIWPMKYSSNSIAGRFRGIPMATCRVGYTARR